MSDEQIPPAPDDSTLGGEPMPIQRRPRELPRRGYEGQPRPMTPPPPPPAPPPQQQQQRWTQPYQEPPHQQPPVYQAPVAAPPPRVAATPPRRPSKSDSGLYLPWWSLLILVIVAGAGAFGLLYVVLNIGRGLIPGDQTPQVIVITNALQPNINTGGVNANSTAIVTTPGGIPTVPIVAPTAVPFAEPTETALPGVTTGCPRNAQVEVIGTGGLPLLIRSGPSQNDPIQGQAAEGERMRIIDGPQTTTGVDGVPIEFCKIEGITVPSRLGWAARQYLGIISE